MAVQVAVELRQDRGVDDAAHAASLLASSSGA
jgi:hypothetical protein